MNSTELWRGAAGAAEAAAALFTRGARNARARAAREPSRPPDDAAEANLRKVDHIVVLMLENRSFDHMLGYLKLDGVLPEVEGLTEGMGNFDPDGVFRPVEPLGRRLIHEKVLDPGHGRRDVETQLSDRNGGFLASYVEAFEHHRERLGDRAPADLEFDPTLVLGYQRAADVPVFDWIARNFHVCDHWFSSVPGPTWPNRLYATTGGDAERVEARTLDYLPEHLRNAPIYDRPAFVRWLRQEDWRWYSHDPATLRMIDSRYRPGGEPNTYSDRNFAYFNRKSLLEWRTFIDDARNGELPAVSWIDPNFVDFQLFGPPGSNDDHPPSRVMLGQELVLTVLRALTASPQWPQTLLLVTYDEHGGFYDHVFPGDFSIPGDPDHSYGVRVPALVVSPYVDTGVSKTVFDHTSIVKTILLRFASDPDRALAAMGARTAYARHLGELLTRPTGSPRPTATVELDALVRTVAAWKQRAYQERRLEEAKAGEQFFEALTDLQREVVQAATSFRAGDVPPGTP